jgi:hypothetical protein
MGKRDRPGTNNRAIAQCFSILTLMLFPFYKLPGLMTVFAELPPMDGDAAVRFATQKAGKSWKACNYPWMSVVKKLEKLVC